MYTRKYQDVPMNMTTISKAIGCNADIESEYMIDACIELCAFRNMSVYDKRIAYDCREYAQTELLKLDFNQLIIMLGAFRHTDFDKDFILDTLKIISNGCDKVNRSVYFLKSVIEAMFLKHSESWHLMDNGQLFQFMVCTALISEKYDVQFIQWKNIFMENDNYPKLRNRLVLLYGNRINITTLEEYPHVDELFT